MVDTWHYALGKTQWNVQSVDPNVNCGLYSIAMYQSWFINYNKCDTPIQDVSNRENCGFVSGIRRSTWEFSVLSV